MLAVRSEWLRIAASPTMSPGPSWAISLPCCRTETVPDKMMYALSAPVFSEIGAQPSGRVTRVPAELILAISSGLNALKNDMRSLSVVVLPRRILAEVRQRCKAVISQVRAGRG